MLEKKIPKDDSKYDSIGSIPEMAKYKNREQIMIARGKGKDKGRREMGFSW